MILSQPSKVDLIDFRFSTKIERKNRKGERALHFFTVEFKKSKRGRQEKKPLLKISTRYFLLQGNENIKWSHLKSRLDGVRGWVKISDT